MTHARLLMFAAATLALSAAAQTIERVRLTDNDLGCSQLYGEAQQMDSLVQLAGKPPPPAAPPVAATVQPDAQLSAVQQAVLNHPNNANLTPAQKATLAAQTGLAQTRGHAAVAALYAGAPTAGALRGAVIADPGVQAAMARARAAGLSDAQIAATMGAGMQHSGLGAAAGFTDVSAPGVAGGLAGLFGALAGSLAPQAAAPPAAPSAALPPLTPPAGTGAQAQARKEHLTSLFLSRGCKMADVRP